MVEVYYLPPLQHTDSEFNITSSSPHHQPGTPSMSLRMSIISPNTDHRYMEDSVAHGQRYSVMHPMRRQSVDNVNNINNNNNNNSHHSGVEASTVINPSVHTHAQHHQQQQHHDNVYEMSMTQLDASSVDMSHLHMSSSHYDAPASHRAPTHAFADVGDVHNDDGVMMMDRGVRNLNAHNSSNVLYSSHNNNSNNSDNTLVEPALVDLDESDVLTESFGDAGQLDDMHHKQSETQNTGSTLTMTSV